MPNSRWGLLLASLLLVVVGGCGADDDERSAEEGRIGFDLYLGDRLDVIEYAVNLLKAECMRTAGYPQLAGVVRQYGNERWLALTPARFRGFESEDQARERGFGMSLPAEPRRVVSYDANFDRKHEECRAEAEAAVDPETRRIRDAYQDLGNQMNDQLTVVIRKRVAQDFPSIADCMEQEGFPVQNRAAFERLWDVKYFGVPLGSVQGGEQWQPDPAKGGVQVGPPVPERQYVPTARESDLAAAWYRCDERSDRVDRLLADLNAEAALIVRRHEDRLAALNPELDRVAKQAADLTDG